LITGLLRSEMGSGLLGVLVAGFANEGLIIVILAGAEEAGEEVGAVEVGFVVLGPAVAPTDLTILVLLLVVVAVLVVVIACFWRFAAIEFVSANARFKAGCKSNIC
jgi:hypothetical protein